MGLSPILSIIHTVSIGKMLNFKVEITHTG